MEMVILHAVLCNKLQGTVAVAESKSSKMAESNNKREEKNMWTIAILMELVHGNHRTMKYLYEWVTVTPHNLQ